MVCIGFEWELYWLILKENDSWGKGVCELCVIEWKIQMIKKNRYVNLLWVFVFVMTKCDVDIVEKK